MKPLIIQAEARIEFDAAIQYLEQQEQGLGLDLQAEVEQTISRIQSMPGIGSPFRTTPYRFLTVRRLLHGATRLYLDRSHCSRQSPSRLLAQTSLE